MKVASPASKRRKVTSKSGEAKYDKLWESEEVTKGWNARGEKYWKEQGADTIGMTGGGVSRADMAFSRMAMDDLTTKLRKGSKKVGGKKVQKATKKPTKKVGGKGPDQRLFSSALELGAGIGRVSHGVLRHYCREVHLVEFMKTYLAKAKKTLPRKGCKYNFTCSSAQKFRIASNRYDLIWCQWLLMYLTDTDAVDLLKRAREGLGKAGPLVVKENVMKAFKRNDEDQTFENDKDETWTPGSGKGPMTLVRTRKHFEHLFKRAGWKIRGSRLQVGVTGVFEDMHFWVLENPKK